MLQQHRKLDDPLVRYTEFQRCIDRAEVLEERLNDLHDAVEYAVEHLNRVTAEDDGTFASSDDLQVALSRLNRVL